MKKFFAPLLGTSIFFFWTCFPSMAHAGMSGDLGIGFEERIGESHSEHTDCCPETTSEQDVLACAGDLAKVSPKNRLNPKKSCGQLVDTFFGTRSSRTISTTVFTPVWSPHLFVSRKSALQVLRSVVLLI